MADEASGPGPGGDLTPRAEHERASRDEHELAPLDEREVTSRDQPAPGGAGLRASHDDRDRAVEVLRVAAGDGRITAEARLIRDGRRIIVAECDVFDNTGRLAAKGLLTYIRLNERS